MSEYKKKKELDKEVEQERYERIATSLETIARCMELFLKELMDSKAEEEEESSDKQF